MTQLSGWLQGNVAAQRDGAPATAAPSPVPCKVAVDTSVADVAGAEPEGGRAGVKCFLFGAMGCLWADPSAVITALEKRSTQHTRFP